jgi:hypothetical protein
MGKAPFQYIDFMHSTNWLIDPEGSYANWQAEEAAGADRRPFAEQSIVQHRAMFSRFHRYLASRGQTVAAFGSDHIDGFLIHIAPDCADGTTTQIGYLKLIDRLTRYPVDAGVRQESPAARSGCPRARRPTLFICSFIRLALSRKLAFCDNRQIRARR